MYRPPSRAPKGDWANHLHAERRRRDLSQNQAFEIMRERLHLSPRSRAVYTALDMGDRQPRPEEAEALASEFGWPPEGLSAAGAAESVDSVAAAIREQTAIAHADSVAQTAAIREQAQAAREQAAATRDQIELLRHALESGIVPGLLDWADIVRQRREVEATPPPPPKSAGRQPPVRTP